MRVRTNIYLDDRQARELRQRGLDEGRSMADLVREGIDRVLTPADMSMRGRDRLLGDLPTGPLPTNGALWARRPYFLHDSPITWAEYVAMLHSADDVPRRWALTRLLDAARWDDIWCLVTMEDIRRDIAQLRFRGQRSWERLSRDSP